MSARLKRCLAFLELIVNTGKVSTTLTRCLLEEASKDQATCVIEIVINTLRGNIKIPNSVKNRLSRSKVVLRKLSVFQDPSRRSEAPQALGRHYKTVVLFLSQCIPFIRIIAKDGAKFDLKRERKEERYSSDSQTSETEEESINVTDNSRSISSSESYYSSDSYTETDTDSESDSTSGDSFSSHRSDQTSNGLDYYTDNSSEINDSSVSESVSGSVSGEGQNDGRIALKRRNETKERRGSRERCSVSPKSKATTSITAVTTTNSDTTSSVEAIPSTSDGDNASHFPYGNESVATARAGNEEIDTAVGRLE